MKSTGEDKLSIHLAGWNVKHAKFIVLMLVYHSPLSWQVLKTKVHWIRG